MNLRQDLEDALRDEKARCSAEGHDFDIADALTAIWPVLKPFHHFYDKETGR